MKAVLRSLAAFIVGTLVTLILLSLVEAFSAVVHPLPPDFGGTMEEMCQHVAHYPNWILAVVVPAWCLAAFAGTWTAIKIGSRAAAVVIGLLLLSALFYNISKLPYPIWFKVVCLLAIPAAIVLGGRRSTPRKTLAVDPMV
jgi:hypothetical protein